MSNSPNLHDLMLLYLADALDETEHAFVKTRLTQGDPVALEALREARELFATLPMALDPITPSDDARANLHRLVEAEALRQDPPASVSRQRTSITKNTPRATAPLSLDGAHTRTAPRRAAPGVTRPAGGWVVSAALAAGFAIAASVLCFLLVRWDAQAPMKRVHDETRALQQQNESQARQLLEQAQALDAQAQRLAEQDESLRLQAQRLEAQRDQLASQDGQIDRVALSLQAQEAVTDELRGLFANQQDDLMVLMRREDEARRVLSLLSAPRLEAYVLAGTADAPDAAGRMFYDPQTRRLRLTVAGLDPTDAGQTYQAWFVLDEGAGTPVSLGTFNTNAQGEAVFEATLAQAPSDIAMAAVSVEPAGGVPAPTGAIVIAGGSQ